MSDARFVPYAVEAGPEAPPLLPGLSWADLFDPCRLRDLDGAFLARLSAEEPDVAARLVRYRAGEELAPTAVSELLVAAARPLSRFLAGLFGVEAEREKLLAAAGPEASLYRLRWAVVTKRVLKRYPDAASLAGLDPDRTDRDGEALVALLSGDAPTTGAEEALARASGELLDLAAALSTPPPREAAPGPAEARRRVAALRPGAADRGLPAEGDEASLLAAWTALLDAFLARLLHAPEHRARTASWASLRVPRPLRFEALVETQRPYPDLPEAREGLPAHRRHRDGFVLTDPRKGRSEVAVEAHYCLLCHAREKDSCSRGLRARDGSVRENPLGVPLGGCPLEERISEMHQLRREGDSLGALALVTVDNPMLPGTGHRICNDCMKACVFQTQDPVDIPQVETGVLTDVLSMPWGFEIWSLLTRWNPLNRRRPYALPYNGRNVLVVGLGPAGYTLAHHLANEGFGVVAVDGLKIEPLPRDLVGSTTRPPRPVRDVSELKRPLAERTISGFGGVSEYGITVRWDKSFLDLVHLCLARRGTYEEFGGVRFGGTLTAGQAFDLGFDHVAIAAGAGKPTLVPMRNGLLKGVRQASDFLMGLQLTGAYRDDALANLHLDLPVVVVGGGLTAIDTATEALAYYPVHVEKVLSRYETLVAERGEGTVLSGLSAEERAKLERHLAHARAIRAEREEAGRDARAPRLSELCRGWGGSTIAYRRRMEESPAYRLNHEEIAKALEEGIVFAEGLEPVEAVPDEHGAVSAVVFRRGDGTTVTLPCRTLLVAAGTSPNVTYGREHEGSIPFDGRERFFLPHAAERGEDGRFRLVPRPGGAGAFFTGADFGGRFLSYFGDNHPRYAGSVVKAMASARDGAPEIRRLFGEELDALERDGFPGQEERDARWRTFASRMTTLLDARVVRVDRLTPTIVEVVVEAPLAARSFRPGQFYRFQNYEAYAPRVASRPGAPPAPLLIEPCALTGAWVDKEAGLLSMIALELGTSTRLCSALTPGERVVVMGPTGAPTELPEGSTVVLCGGGLGNAVLFSIGRAARQKGNRVLYFAAYRKADDFYKRDEIEAGADCVVFSVDAPPAIPARREQDFSFVGNVVQAMTAYATGALGPTRVKLEEATRVIVIGSDRMMAAVAAARRGALAPHFRPDHVGIGSINSPMQCMMKEVCAQCLQRHVDPVTGKESIVFSCFNQDQRLDSLDWENLRARLTQNSLEEKMANLWLDHLLAVDDPRRV
ncbi:MAG: pyridine nucleotide-disulfide oxidoreductase [Acidobacteria bacterium]|nr:MAG: pyridine nucleotide-disulfide oxidoreductase [Acidobacteriota bacterium]